MLNHHTDQSIWWPADACCGCGKLLDLLDPSVELESDEAIERGGAAGPWEPVCLALFVLANPPTGAIA